MQYKNQIKFAHAPKLSQHEQDYTFWMLFFMIQALIEGKLSSLSMRKLTRFILLHKALAKSLNDSQLDASNEAMRNAMHAITLDPDKHEWRLPNEQEQAAMWRFFDSYVRMMKFIGAKDYAIHWRGVEILEEDAIKKGKAMNQDALIEFDTETGRYHSPSTDYLRDMALQVLRSLKDHALTLLRLKQEMEVNQATMRRLGLIIAPLVKQGLIEKVAVEEHNKQTTAYSYATEVRLAA